MVSFNLSEEQRKEYLETTRSRLVKAAFGDTTAENELIEEFKTERQFYEKTKLARTLAYMGTDKAFEALISGIAEDNSFTISQNWKKSIRLYYIDALNGAIPNDRIKTK
ncbi:hypothetical protein CHISP_3624 [Chitinispirillum alkaliphilum]|nr:hypothetical protein CHISP_3624 [Chitinispirillum alkaliphilum]